MTAYVLMNGLLLNIESQWQVLGWKWSPVDGPVPGGSLFAPVPRKAETLLHPHPELPGPTNSFTPTSLL